MSTTREASIELLSSKLQALQRRKSAESAKGRVTERASQLQEGGLDSNLISFDL